MKSEVEHRSASIVAGKLRREIQPSKGFGGKASGRSPKIQRSRAFSTWNSSTILARTSPPADLRLPHISFIRRDDELPTMERRSLLALTALIAVSSLSSSVDAASSHSSWRLPSLLNRSLRKLYRHRRHDDIATSTISSSVLDIDNVAALSSPIKNAVFCVRGGGEINGPCIGIDLGKFPFL